MPYLYRAPGPQELPAPKDARITHSSGQSLEELRQTCLQKGVLLEDADFPANSSSLFYSERPQLPFVWKRRGVSAARAGGQQTGGVQLSSPGGGIKGRMAWEAWAMHKLDLGTSPESPRRYAV